jgi:hypothetical protein
MKTASFTVHADVRQSARWKQASEGEGFPSVGSWLAGAADAYLKARARAGMPIPLAWRRGRFQVEFQSGELVEVNGQLSPPFCSFWERLTVLPATAGGSVTPWSTSLPDVSWQRFGPTASPGLWLPSWPASGSVATVWSRRGSFPPVTRKSLRAGPFPGPAPIPS